MAQASTAAAAAHRAAVRVACASSRQQSTLTPHARTRAEEAHFRGLDTLGEAADEAYEWASTARTRAAVLQQCACTMRVLHASVYIVPRDM